MDTIEPRNTEQVQAQGSKPRVSLEPPYPTLKQGILLLVLLLLFQLVLSAALSGVSMLLGASQETAMLVSIVIANPIAFGLVLLIGALKARQPLRVLFPMTSFCWTALLPSVAILVGIQIVGSEIYNLVRSLAPMPQFLREPLEAIVSGGLLGSLALLLVAPVTEELFFRGLVLNGFIKNYSVRKAVVASALLFALMHLNPYQFLPTFVLGLLLAWLFVRTRSLVPCLILHCFNNGVHKIVKILGIEIPGYSMPQEGLAAPQLQPWWFTLVGVALLVAGFYGLAKVLGRRDRDTA